MLCLDKKILKNSLKVLNKLDSLNKSTIPNTRLLLFNFVSENVISISATTLEVSCEIFITCEERHDSFQSFTCQLSTFTNVLDIFKDRIFLNIKYENKIMEVKDSKITYNINISEGNEFPKYKPEGNLNPDYKIVEKIDSKKFVNSIARLLTCIPKTECRMYGTPAAFLIDKYFEKSRAVSTNGIRMCVEKLDFNIFEGFMLPYCLAYIISKFFNKKECIIFKEFQDVVVFEIENMKIYARKIEGKFPDCSKDVIDRETFLQVKVDRKNFINTLNKILTGIRSEIIEVRHEEYRKISMKDSIERSGVIKLTVDKNTINISSVYAKNPISDKYTCEVLGDLGFPFSIGFYISNVIDILKCIDTNFIYVKFIGNEDVVYFLPDKGTNRFEYLFLVMPACLTL